MAMRFLVIDQYYGKNDRGADVYKKLSQLHCSRTTAQKRLEQFENLIRDWDKRGYDPQSIIRITDKNEIIDGTHRMALALYHGLREVRCDVYQNVEITDLDNANFLLPEERMNEAGLSAEEKQMLKEARCLIHG